MFSQCVDVKFVIEVLLVKIVILFAEPSKFLLDSDIAPLQERCFGFSVMKFILHSLSSGF
jgi:hypothetical protein